MSTSFCRVDGGISNNDFVLELMSSLTCQTIDRPSQTDMSTLGAAFLAGLAAGKFRYFICRGSELSPDNTDRTASTRDRIEPAVYVSMLLGNWPRHDGMTTFKMLSSARKRTRHSFRIACFTK